MRSNIVSYILKAVAFIFVYLVLANIGFYFALPPTNITVFWPPSGISLALMFFVGVRRACAPIFIAYFVTLVSYYFVRHEMTALQGLQILISAGGTTLQSALAYYYIRPDGDLWRVWYSQRRVLNFARSVLMAAFIAPSLGAGSLALLNFIPTTQITTVWLTWYLGDVLGMLLFAPAMVIIFSPGQVLWTRPLGLRILGFACTTLLGLYLVFVHPLTSAYPLLWVTFALLIWCAFLFGPRGVILCNLGIACFAIISTTLQRNVIFSIYEPLHAVYVLQLYIGVLVLVSLSVAALLQEREETLLKVQEANQSRELFLAKMSHELRTPLNSILGFTHILLNKENSLSGKEQSYLTRVHANGMHLLDLINDVLDLTKIEAGKMEVRLQRICVQVAVRELLERHQSLYLSKQLIIEQELPEASVYIQADPEKFAQVLSNLLSNAVKFSPSGRSIRFVLHLDDKGSAQALDIMDQGIGVAPEQQAKIFNAFEQVDNQNSRQYGGTGLGLNIAKEFCLLMGFQLILKASNDKGSTFTILFQEHP